MLHSRILPYRYHVSEAEEKDVIDENANDNAVAIDRVLHRLEGLSLIPFTFISCMVISRLKHLACLFSLNMFKQDAERCGTN